MNYMKICKKKWFNIFLQNWNKNYYFANYYFKFCKMENANITLTNEQTELLQNTNYSNMPYNEAKILFVELCKFIDNEIIVMLKKLM